MNAREALLAEFDHEMAVTRQVLERVPDTAFAWRPHERSFSMGGLATHLARLPHWGTHILNQDGYDLSASTGKGAAESESSPDAVVALFDAHVAEVRRALIGRTDGELSAPWALTQGSTMVLTMPRIEALRRFLVHHVIHHRGQLTVYLRLQNVPLPPIYGPSADEPL